MKGDSLDDGGNKHGNDEHDAHRETATLGGLRLLQNTAAMEGKGLKAGGAKSATNPGLQGGGYRM